ncbi:hypothetical protein LTR22_027172 [Elasticomyces elasticus]|nr:hypothetical protein LTR22_027172 [Elasticomyces elasticus]
MVALKCITSRPFDGVVTAQQTLARDSLTRIAHSFHYEGQSFPVTVIAHPFRIEQHPAQIFFSFTLGVDCSHDEVDEKQISSAARQAARELWQASTWDFDQTEVQINRNVHHNDKRSSQDQRCGGATEDTVHLTSSAHCDRPKLRIAASPQRRDRGIDPSCSLSGSIIRGQGPMLLAPKTYSLPTSKSEEPSTLRAVLPPARVGDRKPSRKNRPRKTGRKDRLVGNSAAKKDVAEADRLAHVLVRAVLDGCIAFLRVGQSERMQWYQDLEQLKPMGGNGSLVDLGGQYRTYTSGCGRRAWESALLATCAWTADDADSYSDAHKQTHQRERKWLAALTDLIQLASKEAGIKAFNLITALGAAPTKFTASDLKNANCAAANVTGERAWKLLSAQEDQRWQILPLEFAIDPSQHLASKTRPYDLIRARLRLPWFRPFNRVPAGLLTPPPEDFAAMRLAEGMLKQIAQPRQVQEPAEDAMWISGAAWANTDSPLAGQDTTCCLQDLMKVKEVLQAKDVEWEHHLEPHVLTGI